MDGRASQYVAHLSAQNCRVEMVHALTDAMMSLLNSFKDRNGGKMPAHIIIFRDGVSDGQFDQVHSYYNTLLQSNIEGTIKYVLMYFVDTFTDLL